MDKLVVSGKRKTAVAKATIEAGNGVITFNKSVSFGLLFFIKTYLDNNGNNIYYLNTVIDSIFLPERDSMLNFKIQV